VLLAGREWLAVRTEAPRWSGHSWCNGICLTEREGRWYVWAVLILSRTIDRYVLSCVLKIFGCTNAWHIDKRSFPPPVEPRS
jgi:hypothetical protein